MHKIYIIIISFNLFSCGNFNEKTEQEPYDLSENEKLQNSINYEKICDVNYRLNYDTINAPNDVSIEKKIKLIVKEKRLDIHEYSSELGVYTSGSSRAEFIVPNDKNSVKMSTYISIGFTSGIITEPRTADPKLSEYKNINNCNQSIFFGIEYPWKDTIEMYECNGTSHLGTDNIYKIDNGFFLCSLRRENFVMYLDIPKTSEKYNFNDNFLYDFIESQSGQNGIMSGEFENCIQNEMNKDTLPENDRYNSYIICKFKKFKKFKIHIYIPAINQHLSIDRFYIPGEKPNFEQRINDVSSRWHGVFGR
jgi:hypothetical protein